MDYFELAKPSDEVSEEFITEEMGPILRDLSSAITDYYSAEEFIIKHANEVRFGKKKLRIMNESICTLLKRMENLKSKKGE